MLTTFDLDGVVEYIVSGKCANIITMAGAGISTSAGIPDFRSPGSGLYSNLAKFDLPHPGAVFEISYFKKNPEPFFTLVKSLFPAKLVPTPCHYFIRLLHEKKLLLRHYTQNIDNLERLAGVPEERIIEAHGSFRTGHCLKCHEEYTQDWMKEKIFESTIPHCTNGRCKGVVKPDIVFFGEHLPSNFVKNISKDFAKCDLLIILGTSLVVQPFASLIHKVKKKTPRLYINLEYKPGENQLFSIFGNTSDFMFGKAKNTRDVFWKGTCDEGCMYLAKTIGWESDFKSMIQEGAKKENK